MVWDKALEGPTVIDSGKGDCFTTFKVSSPTFCSGIVSGRETDVSVTAGAIAPMLSSAVTLVRPRESGAGSQADSPAEATSDAISQPAAA